MKLLWTVLLCSAVPAMAAEPFTGIWKMDASTLRFSNKPIRYELANGTYKCLDCDPPVVVKADGTDQPVAGQPAYDTMSVRIIDDHTIEVVTKKAGRPYLDSKRTVAPDGRTATNVFTRYPESGNKPFTITATFRRVGGIVAGAHAFSGSWVQEKAETVSEHALLVTYAETADGLKMSTETGEHYDARFDGKEYPYEGDPRLNRVVLRRIDPQTIEEVQKDSSLLGMGCICVRSVR